MVTLKNKPCMYAVILAACCGLSGKKYTHASISQCKLLKQHNNEKSAQREANTARALAAVRFGHRPPVANTRVTDRTDNNTLRR